MGVSGGSGGGRGASLSCSENENRTLSICATSRTSALVLLLSNLCISLSLIDVSRTSLSSTLRTSSKSPRSASSGASSRAFALPRAGTRSRMVGGVSTPTGWGAGDGTRIRSRLIAGIGVIGEGSSSSSSSSLTTCLPFLLVRSIVRLRVLVMRSSSASDASVVGARSVDSGTSEEGGT